MKRPSTWEETGLAWLDYVKGFSYPEKPNAAERRRKVRELGISEDAYPLLQRVLSPPYWRTEGRLPKVPRRPDDNLPGQMVDYMKARRHQQ